MPGAHQHTINNKDFRMNAGPEKRNSG
jgi:hypothetical protein